MASIFYGYHVANNVNPNQDFIYSQNQKQGIYSLPFLFEKYLDTDYSRLFAKAKITQNVTFMKRGFYPNEIMGDIDSINSHYNQLNDMFKLD